MDSTSSVVSNENSILLTLPNVSHVVGENESEESEQNGSHVGGIEEGGEPTVILENPSLGQLETTPVTNAADEEEYFCHQHLSNRDRLSPELQDVYKLLMQLPTFSHSSWSGFNADANGKMANNGNASSVRNMNYLGKTRKKVFVTGKKVTKTHTQTGTFEDDQMVSLAFEDDITQDVESQNKLPIREAVKMHSINLYQSILPSSLFTRRRQFK